MTKVRQNANIRHLKKTMVQGHQILACMLPVSLVNHFKVAIVFRFYTNWALSAWRERGARGSARSNVIVFFVFYVHLVSGKIGNA